MNYIGYELVSLEGLPINKYVVSLNLFVFVNHSQYNFILSP